MFNLFSDSDFMKLVQASAPRKAEASKRLKYYFDEQAEDLYRLIASRFSEPETFRILFFNIVRKVIDRRAALYRDPPLRVFGNMDQETGQAIYAAMGADIVLPKACRYTKLLKTTLLQVGHDGTSPTLAVVTGNIADVVADDPWNPSKVIITHAAERPEWVEYSEWTASTYRRLDYKGRAMTLKGNPDGTNPFGILPFVPCFDRDPDDAFWLSGGNDLLIAQEALSTVLCSINKSVELQSFGQAWAVGIPPGEALRSGPDRVLTLPEGGSFGFASPNTPTRAILDYCEFILRQVAAANDLDPAVFGLDQHDESGAASLMRSRDLYEARQTDVALWRRHETRLWEVVKRVVNTYAPNTIPEDASIRVDFTEPMSSLNENSRLEAYSRRISMGLWSPVDALLEDNPDLTSREQAISILTERAAETQRFLPSLTMPTYGTPGT